ncbi:MAG TPA: ABC transporter substrate-binding protein [Casimicrobiaceae bacterium]|nr:ABC transporter substrate-binding protein [Casimicrobiaceae bacterium]
MTRFLLVFLLALAVGVPELEAQPVSKVARIGVLSPGSPPPLEAIRTGMRELGYGEGKNLVFEWRFAEGRNDRLPALAADLVALKPDVLIAINTQAAQAAKSATADIPIVFVRVSDPRRTGLVASLSKPGANVTGVSNVADEIGGKRLETLKSVLPDLTRISVLWNAGNPGVALILKDVEQSSAQLGVQVHNAGVRDASELAAALEAIRTSRPGALFVLDDLLLTASREAILEFAARNRLPVMSLYEEFVRHGGLISYGPSIEEMYRRATRFVDRILKGAIPGDLPVEQPTQFELVVNLKAARELGVEVPAAVLGRADKVLR